MPIFLLDTNIIIDLLNNRYGRREQLDAFLTTDASLACTSINITEIYMGVKPQEAAKTKAFFARLDYFPVTLEIAEFAGRLFSQWRLKGQTLSFTDVSIAAVCIANELTLVTNNQKHFPMPELRLINLPRRG